jgi:hypothetical protein
LRRVTFFAGTKKVTKESASATRDRQARVLSAWRRVGYPCKRIHRGAARRKTPPIHGRRPPGQPSDARPDDL